MTDDLKRDQHEDLGTQGAKDTVRGKSNETVGRVEQAAGDLTGNKKTKAKGAGRETKGKIQSKIGEIKQKVDDTLKH